MFHKVAVIAAKKKQTDEEEVKQTWRNGATKGAKLQILLTVVDPQNRQKRGILRVLQHKSIRT